MKNAINYYYNLITNNIHQRDKEYTFTVNNENYLLTVFNGDINKVNVIYRYLIEHNIYCHEIILNKDYQMVTIINNEPYILIKNYGINRNVNLNDIINYTIYIEGKYKCNWKEKWCEKLDYYEYQMEQFEKKYPELSSSFCYFDGMTEIAISLMNTIDITKVETYISHYRINKNTNLWDLYNPLKLTIDTRVRDICEYLKNEFFYVQNPIQTVHQYLNSLNLSYEECILFLARMIYPSYYYDLYDAIILEKEKVTKLEIIIKKIDQYEQFLRDIYVILNSKYKMPEIEWLIKT